MGFDFVGSLQRNDYEKDVYNGDMGVIVGVSDADKSVRTEPSSPLS